jgi:hypothetical protein
MIISLAKKILAEMENTQGVTMKTRKGQAATEMLVTIGMVLIFIIPILLLLLVVAQLRFETLSEVQGSSAIRIMADSVNEIYLEGPGATKVVVVNLPTNTKNLSITENEVIITLETRSGENQLVVPFFGNVTSGSIREIKTDVNGRAPVGLYPIRFTTESDEDSPEYGKVVIEHGNELE